MIRRKDVHAHIFLELLLFNLSWPIVTTMDFLGEFFIRNFALSQFFSLITSISFYSGILVSLHLFL